MMTPVARTVQVLVILATAAPLACSRVDDELPRGFVRLGDAIPGIVLDVRYFGADNFVGAPVDGYEAPVAILSRPAATALRRVQAALRERGFGLKVFDAYRPQTAVDHFVRWAADYSDNRTKAEYYPDVPKSELFARDYIAKKSGHSRARSLRGRNDRSEKVGNRGQIFSIWRCIVVLFAEKSRKSGPILPLSQ